MRSASAWFSRPSDAARRARCRRVACQRRTDRRHSGSWQYHWFHCRARYRRPHPLRRQVRHPSRRPVARRWLAGRLVPLVSCARPMGGYDSLGPPGEDALDPPRALHPCHLVFLRPPPRGRSTSPSSSPPPPREGNQESQTRCFPPLGRMSSNAKETWKNTYQIHLALKETEEDHPTEEEPLRTRRKETR